MKTFILLFGLVGSSLAYGQQSINGLVESPPLSTVRLLSSNDRPLDFSSIENYTNGQLIQNYCQLEVKSNHSWVLSAVLNDYSGVGGILTSSPDLIKVKVQGTNQFVSLVPGVPIPIFVSNNQLLRNSYVIDVWVDPKLKLGDHSIKQLQLSFQLASN